MIALISSRVVIKSNWVLGAEVGDAGGNLVLVQKQILKRTVAARVTKCFGALGVCSKRPFRFTRLDA